jgi:hypothetical protein
MCKYVKCLKYISIKCYEILIENKMDSLLVLIGITNSPCLNEAVDKKLNMFYFTFLNFICAL